MAYVPGANYSYSITPAAGGAAPSSYVPPNKRVANFGNVFQAANANPMDYSLYTNYYSTTPTKGLSDMLKSEYDAVLSRTPSGAGGNAWINQTLPQLSTGNTRGFSMASAGAPIQTAPAAGGYAAAQTPEQWWAASNRPGTPSLGQWNNMTTEERNYFVAKQQGWI